MKIQVNSILILTLLFSLLAANCWAELTQDDLKKATAWLTRLDLVSQSDNSNPEKLEKAVKVFQEQKDIPVTGKIDVRTYNELYVVNTMFDLKNEGKVVEIRVSRSKLTDIHKMPSGTVYFMSKANRFTSVTEVKDGEFGVWDGELFYALEEVKFWGSAGRSGYKLIGNGKWADLFVNNPKLKLFVCMIQDSPDKTICGTGGGLRIEFVADELKQDEEPNPKSSKSESDNSANGSTEKQAAVDPAKLAEQQHLYDGIQKLRVGMTPAEVKDAFSPEFQQQLAFFCDLADGGPLNVSLGLGGGHTIMFKDSKLASFK